MVEALLNKTLEKGESRTDWLKRPLSSKQLQYAAEDVLYLLPCYELLIDKLPAHKNAWVAKEIEQLALRKSAEIEPEDAYLLLKNTHKLNPLSLAVLQRLAAWRLRYARRHDITQNFIARETSLYEIALKLPSSKSAIFHLDIVAPQEARKHGDVFAQIVKECRAMDPSEYPAKTQRLMDVPHYKKMYASIKAICQEVAVEVGCELAEMASKRQINQILTWYWWDYDDTRAWGMQPDLLTGWREPLLAQKIQDLILETKR
jgi:ribonuclease D